MRIGLIAWTTNQGLGTVSWELFRHLKPVAVLLVDNGVFQTFPERYKGAYIAKDYKDLVDHCDIVLTTETFLNWQIITYARHKKVKTALITMCEMSPERFPYIPDLLLCPSKLDYDIFKDYSTKVEYIPIPLATDRLTWKERKKAEVFIHTASHGGMNGRKGTSLVVEAMKYVKSPIKLKIYSWKDFRVDDPRVEVCFVNFLNYWQMWDEGDVLIYPQNFNGICLPIIEAMASGMGVITTHLYPFDEYMPPRLMFKGESYYRTRLSPNLKEVPAAHIDPKLIAKKIDEIYGQEIIDESRYGKHYAESHSWRKLLPRYIKALESVCKKN